MAVRRTVLSLAILRIFSAWYLPDVINEVAFIDGRTFFLHASFQTLEVCHHNTALVVPYWLHDANCEATMGASGTG